MTEKKPKLEAIRIVAENQVPLMRHRHSEFYDALLAQARTLPRGKAIEVNEEQAEVASESIRHCIIKEQKAGLLPKQLRVTCRSTEHGSLCYIVNPSKAEE